MKPGGAVVCLGAGSISGWAQRLQAALETLEGKP
jgi:UDP-N-acetylmuramate--alanine ligase